MHIFKTQKYIHKYIIFSFKSTEYICVNNSCVGHIYTIIWIYLRKENLIDNIAKDDMRQINCKSTKCNLIKEIIAVVLGGDRDPGLDQVTWGLNWQLNRRALFS